MNTIHKVLAAVVPLCLGLSTIGCAVGAPVEEDGVEERVGEVKEAWSWDAAQRGWVDVITHVSNPPPGFGPRLPAEYHIEGWACLQPPATASSLELTVYQGGPPGVGTPLSLSYGATTEYRPDTVSYGACANSNSGFGVWVDPVPGVPAVFYVSYHAVSPAVTLEGSNGP